MCFWQNNNPGWLMNIAHVIWLPDENDAEIGFGDKTLEK